MGELTALDVKVFATSMRGRWLDIAPARTHLAQASRIFRSM